MTEDDKKDDSGDDSTFRQSLQDSGYVPDAGGVRFGPAHPKILVAGAYNVIRTAAAKAREVLGRER